MKADVTFQKEFFIDIMRELPPLVLKHYKEVQVEENGEDCNVAWLRYVELERSGALHILTVRVDSHLVGYYFNMLFPHLRHADRLCAWSDVFFVLPEYRREGVGVRLFEENDKMLKELGVKKNFISFKAHIDLRKLLKRLKYTLTEYVMCRWL